MASTRSGIRWSSRSPNTIKHMSDTEMVTRVDVQQRFNELSDEGGMERHRGHDEVIQVKMPRKRHRMTGATIFETDEERGPCGRRHDERWKRRHVARESSATCSLRADNCDCELEREAQDDLDDEWELLVARSTM